MGDIGAGDGGDIGAGGAVTGAGAVVTGAAATGAAVTGEVTQAATLFEDDSLEQSGALAAECTPSIKAGIHRHLAGRVQ